MKRLNPDHVAAIKTRVNSSPYFDLLSMEISSLEQGRSLIEVDVKEKHLQPYGIVHGGVYASLVDAAGFWAVYSETVEGAGLTTVEMKLNYLAPASSGRLIARGKSIKIGKTLCLSEAAVSDKEGKLLAHGTVSLMMLDSLHFQGQDQSPPKFVDLKG